MIKREPKTDFQTKKTYNFKRENLYFWRATIKGYKPQVNTTVQIASIVLESWVYYKLQVMRYGFSWGGSERPGEKLQLSYMLWAFPGAGARGLGISYKLYVMGFSWRGSGRLGDKL
jgi:hypothetical protein